MIKTEAICQNVDLMAARREGYVALGTSRFRVLREEAVGYRLEGRSTIRRRELTRPSDPPPLTQKGSWSQDAGGYLVGGKWDVNCSHVH